MIVEMLTVGPLQENCYLVVDEGSGLAAMVDPGDEAPRLLGALEMTGATLAAIWMTHAHFDHVGAVAEVVRSTHAPIWLHPLDRRLWDYAAKSATMYGIEIENPPPPDHDLADGMQVSLGSLVFSVMHAPGHAPGHVVFHGHGLVFAGDCLFAGSIGRTDLPYSDPRALAKSLEQIATLPEDARVHPGHGPSTSIGVEKRTNPFLTGLVRVVGS